MRLMLPTALAVMLAGAAFAQGNNAAVNTNTATPPSAATMPSTPSATVTSPPGGTPNAVRTGAAASSAPLAGRNSFTMAQARRRITAAGYTGLAGLKKDGQGIWRAQAQKDGSPVAVSMDFRGAVTAQ